MDARNEVGGNGAPAGMNGSGPNPRRHVRQGVELDWKSRLIFYAMVAAVHALSLIPDFLLYPIGIVGGWLGYRLDRRHVRIGLRNLAIAFPDRSESQRREVLQASYENLGRAAAEIIRLGGFFHRRLVRRVTYHHYQYWRDLLARDPGKGMLILTAHFGNFELLLAGHAMHGHQISVVHHTQKFRAGDALITFIRERAGVDILRKHSAARAVLRALHSGDLVGIPFDQNAKRSEAIYLPWFGELAATASGIARLAQVSRAPVLPVFLIRQPDMRTHVIDIQDEIPVQRTGDHEADTVENTRRFMKAIEDVVRRYPEQFLWTHRRYRTRPRGLPPVYDWETRGNRRTSDNAVAN